MQGIEQTYNRPYYAAEGGLMGLAEGGSAEENKTYDNVEMSLAMRQLLAQQDRSLREIQRLKAQQAGTPPAQLDQKQLFADYLQRVSGGTGTGAGVGMGTGAGIGAIPWQNTQTNAKIDLPFLETPVASNTQSGNGGGGGGGGYGSSPEGRAEREARFDKMKPEEIEAHRATNEAIGKTLDFGAKLVTPLGFLKDLFAPKDTRFFADIPGNESLVKTVNDFNGDFYTPSLSGLEAGRTTRPTVTPASEEVQQAISNIDFSGMDRGSTSNAPKTPDTQAVQNAINNIDFSGMDRGSTSNAPKTPDTQAVQNAINSTDFSGMDRGSTSSGNHDTAPSSGDGGYSDSNAKSDRTGGFNNAQGGYLQNGQFDQRMARGGNVRGNLRPPQPFFQNGKFTTHPAKMYADGGELNPYDLGSYSDGGRLLKGPGDGVSDSIPATIGKGRPARLADGEFVIPARIVSEIGNGSTEAGARKLYAMMDRIQAGRKKSVGKGKVAVNSRADKYLPA